MLTPFLLMLCLTRAYVFSSMQEPLVKPAALPVAEEDSVASLLAALASGLIFSAGLGLSGM